MAEYVESSDSYGNSINAGKTGGNHPHPGQALLSERGETEKTVSLNCGSSTLTCSKIVGARQYSIDTINPLENPLNVGKVTFTGPDNVTQEGIRRFPDDGGIYTATYTLKPGLNTIAVRGTGTIGVKKTDMSCPATCNTINNAPFTQEVSITMQVYGVDIKTQPLPIIFIDEKGYLEKEQTITYTIEPLKSDYKAMTAYVMIFIRTEILSRPSPPRPKARARPPSPGGSSSTSPASMKRRSSLNYGSRSGDQRRQDKTSRCPGAGARG